MGYHIAVTDLREGGTLEELASLPDQGVTSYKLFMAYKGALMVDDETLFRTMEVAAETGALVMVHAENGDAIDVLVQAGARRRATPSRTTTRSRGRPRPRARRRTARSSSRASPAAPLYVVHVSCARGGRADRARPREGLGRLGRDVHAVLLRRLHVPRAAGLRGREVRLHAAAAATRRTRTSSGTRSARTSSRPSRPTTAPSSGTARSRSGSDDFSKIPNGGPGLENRLHMIHEFGVRQGRITLNRMVELLATNPAKLFGLYPRKGTIAVGSDADLVVFDPEKQAHDHRPRPTTRRSTTTSTRAPR